MIQHNMELRVERNCEAGLRQYSWQDGLYSYDANTWSFKSPQRQVHGQVGVIFAICLYCISLNCAELMIVVLRIVQWDIMSLENIQMRKI